MPRRNVVRWNYFIIFRLKSTSVNCPLRCCYPEPGARVLFVFEQSIFFLSKIIVYIDCVKNGLKFQRLLNSTVLLSSRCCVNLNTSACHCSRWQAEVFKFVFGRYQFAPKHLYLPKYCPFRILWLSIETAPANWLTCLNRA